MELCLQSYPVTDLLVEPTGTALSEVCGVYGVVKLVWNQTWPLFQRPHVQNTLKLCYLMAVLFSIGHGTFMWYAINENINTYFFVYICFSFISKVSRLLDTDARLYRGLYTVQHS